MILASSRAAGPIDQVDLAQVADHHVLRIDVAVSHSAPMGEGQRASDLQNDLQ